MKNISIIVLLYFLSTSYIHGQAKPFPQNINYPNGYKTTLISNNVVQNAYSRWKNLFLKSANGMYRVTEDDTNSTISEGIGFGMLLTAYMGEKVYYDGLLQFYKSKRTPEAYNLMAWKVTRDGISDPGSATDGDIDVAFSLLVAYSQWGGSYLDEAKNIIAILKEHYFVNCSGANIMKPGGQFGGCGLTDPSYYCPAYFSLFGQATNDPWWDTVATDTYTLLLTTASSTTGLVPDWESSTGIAGGNPNSGRVDYYRYDACRCPWRVSLDYLWNGNPFAQSWCTTISNFANSIGAANIVDGYNLDGTRRGQYNNSPFVGGFAVGAMSVSQSITNNFAQRLVLLENSGHDNQYFNLSLRCLYMLALTGNYWKPELTSTLIKKTENLPDKFNLNQNYPNPFNPSTTIRYKISKSSQIKLTIYNMLGQKIKTLLNLFKNAGEYSAVWDGNNENNNPVSSGIYFYRLEAKGWTSLKKTILIR